MSKLISLYICHIYVYIKVFSFFKQIQFCKKAMIFQKYHFRTIYESLIETREIVNHKHEKVKEVVHLVSMNAPQRNVSFRKPEGAHAPIYSSSILRSIPTALSLLFLLFFPWRAIYSVQLCTCPLVARKKGHFTRYHSLPWWIPPRSGRT